MHGKIRVSIHVIVLCVRFCIIMAINSSQIDLNSEAVLLDRENEVVGVKSTVSKVVSVCVSHSETLSGEVAVHDQKVCHVGDGGGVSGSVELVASMNYECDGMVNGSGKEGFGVSVEVVDGGCGGKEGEFLCGMVKNEDEKMGVECSDGVLFACGDEEPHRGFVFEFNNGFQSKLECENVRNVHGNCLPCMAVVSDNVAQGGDNDVVECEQEVKNDALVEDDREENAANSLVTKEDLEDSGATDVATYQLHDGIPCMEVADVNAEESLHMKDLSRNCLELEPSCEVKQPAFQVDVMQNQTMVVDIVQGRVFENIQKESHGFNLVVDFNSYRNMQEVGMYRESLSSELNFCASDLVWGKVTGHPWWPGQIFDASTASEKAKRHFKEHCYLVAYFGDRTFAWNDASMIKPFQMHFSQMMKQCNSENFHHAVDCALEEFSRRVEFALSCPCMPEDMFSMVKTQVISNAGINNRLSRRTGGDRLINAMSFESMKLINFVKSLAQSPLVESDGLDFVAARAQLLAFYRSKGYPQLPEFPVLGGLIDSDMETLLMRGKEQCDYQTHVGYSQQDPKRRSKKHKLLSDLMSKKGFCISNGKHALEQKVKSIPRRRGRKRKAAYNTSEDYLHNFQKRKLTQPQHASINEMRSQLCLAAEDPFRESCSRDTVHFFAEFRNSTSLDQSAYLDQGIPLEQMHDGQVVSNSMTSAMEPCNDSYWTDRIIQSIPEEQSLTQYHNDGAIFLPGTLTEANPLSFKLVPGAEISADFGFNQQDTSRNLGPDSSKLVEHLDESSKEDLCPTALTLKFSSLDSVPSTTDINKIFGRFGPLIESKTELLEKTNRARVVFQRRPDAETAFSSAGKYSIFGPSLVSYRLKILPRKLQKGTGKRGRKRKETSSVDSAVV